MGCATLTAAPLGSGGIPRAVQGLCKSAVGFCSIKRREMMRVTLYLRIYFSCLELRKLPGWAGLMLSRQLG